MLRSLKSQVTSHKSQLIRDTFFILISALLLIIPYCRQGFWITAWFGFVPLFFALQGKTHKQSFFIAYLIGIIFWSGTIYWLVHITLPGTVVLILYLALYFGFFGLISSYLLSSNYSLLSIPCVWVFLEYARSHIMTGFPWALLGYSQYKNLPVVQIADIFGVWGVSFLVMMVNTGIYMAVRAQGARRNKGTIVIIGCLVFSLAYGYYRLNQHEVGARKLKVSIVQGNIPQEFKWRTESEDFIFNRYLELTAAADKDNPDLVIWPEASLPVVLEEDPSYYSYLIEKVKERSIPLLFGAVTQRGGNYYNSALLLDREGLLSDRYDKVHLVPFGEYIPLRNVFPFLQTVVPIGDIAAGKEYTIFKTQNPKSMNQNKLGVLICFEDLFPEISRAYARKDADILVNITNDAWYKYTSAPFQHLQASIFRAIENRLPLARAANTGVSCIIAPDGRILSMVKDARGEEIFVKGFVTADVVSHKKKPTPYSRFGDYFPVICLIFAFYPAIFRRSKYV